VLVLVLGSRKLAAKIDYDHEHRSPKGSLSTSLRPAGYASAGRSLRSLSTPAPAQRRLPAATAPR
jgi:hypothetical protein